MKRSAQLALRLAEDLARRGIEVSRRRLEGWHQLVLGPLPGTPYERQVDHFAALATVATSGRSSDLAAIRLAVRGFPCQRLRGAILREMGMTEVESVVALPRVDTDTCPSGDAGFALVEKAAQEAVDPGCGVPAPMLRLLEALRRNAARFAPKLGESPDFVLHSAAVNALLMAAAGRPYNLKAVAAVMGLDPELVPVDLEGLEDLIEASNFPGRVVASYNSASADHLASCAVLLREALVEGLSPAGCLSDDDLDWLAVVYSPAALAIVACLVEGRALAPTLSAGLEGGGSGQR